MIATSKNKIVEVYAAARVIVQRYGYTKKFAKHIVALVIKEQENLTDEELAEFTVEETNKRELQDGSRIVIIT